MGAGKEHLRNWALFHRKRIRIALDLLLLILIEFILILSFFTIGVSPISKFFFFILIIGWLYIWYCFAEYDGEKRKQRIKIISEIMVFVLIIVGLQAAVPLFLPKISMSAPEMTYGFVNGSTKYASQNVIIDVYPPLFPVDIIVCQDYLIGWNVSNVIQENRILPVIIEQKDINSIRVCTKGADGWMWNKISVPVHFRSYQELRYSKDTNITHFWKLEKDNETYYYTIVSFSNFENLKLNFQRVYFYVNKGEFSWSVLEKYNKSCTATYLLLTEDVNTFPFQLQKPVIIEKYGDTITLRAENIALKENEYKTLYLVVDGYNCNFVDE